MASRQQTQEQSRGSRTRPLTSVPTALYSPAAGTKVLTFPTGTWQSRCVTSALCFLLRIAGSRQHVGELSRERNEVLSAGTV